jgi:hypothetical protein
LRPLTTPPAAPPTTTDWWRGLLLWVLLIGLVGTSVELLLLGHYEDRWQLAPLVVSGAAIAAFAWYGLSTSRRPVQCIRALSLLTLASAVAGLVLHYQANLEWELEVTPELQGLPLFREVITGALPLLAPGAMAQLGLLGLLWSYRHPRLIADLRSLSPSSEH